MLSSSIATTTAFSVVSPTSNHRKTISTTPTKHDRCQKQSHSQIHPSRQPPSPIVNNSRRPRSPPPSSSQPQPQPQYVSRRQFLHIPLSFSFPLFFSPLSALSAEGFITLPCEGSTSCRSVEIRDFRIGTGRAISDVNTTTNTTTTIVIKWTGRLADRYGWPFQRESDDDVTFVLGRDRLIPGFVQGIIGMKEGGKRRLLIPGELGYLDESYGPLPNDYGDRRRLFATVLNKRRFKNAGDLVIDVQLKKVRVQ